MTSREHMAVSVAPLFLRLALSIVFIWTGLGKLMTDMSVSGERAAVLANMGVSGLQRVAQPGAAPSPTAPAPIPSPMVKEPKQEPKKDPAKAPVSGPPALISVIAQQSTPPPTAATFTAADFPNETRVAQLYGIALLLHDAVQPTDREGKPVRFPLAPSFIATGSWPWWLAWAAALTELLGGFLLLFGLFTRLAALGIACVMLTAIWLTQIGPAVQSGNASLGFLPPYPAFDVKAWQTLLWQLCLLCAAMNLVFAGSGGLSMDRAISGRPVVNKTKPAAPAK
ncbi:MAG: DoxX family membrane protein [Phycisphaeraceae bacterium]|nr:DoxX family membrane protein [Phycisphaeraceae bacterium]